MTQLMAKKKITEDRIFEALKNGNELTKDIAKYIGASKERTREKLSEMYNEGKIEKKQIGNTNLYSLKL